ncbi:MAG: acetate kinase [Eggerthellales bacterium]|nr:acetate kinase [Eggerthellales bacterium]
MKILVFNAGSSSVKYKLIESGPATSATAHVPQEVVASGVVERIGTPHSQLISKDFRGTITTPVKAKNAEDAMDAILGSLVGEHAPLKNLEEVEAVGHRIAHGGAEYMCSVPIDEDVKQVIDRYSELAPLHNPQALMVIERCEMAFPDLLQVAAFDTAFHQTMPARNYIYPIPYRYYEEYGIRRFGFHGMSHKYVSRKAAQFLGKDPRDLKMITCHLGAGASLAAIDHGISMDTSMGYTPLDGIMMGTRSGSVDPAIITAIMEKENLTPAQMDQILNKESGMLGVSGASGDLRALKEVIADGDQQAELAYDIFLTSIRRQIGAYFFELAGVDAIVCTAGVGENDPYARRLIFRGLEPFGIHLDHERNMEDSKVARRISTDASSVEVLVIPTDEEAEIARDVALISAGIDISDPYAW